jgi:large subunit ribosomal protein L10
MPTAEKEQAVSQLLKDLQGSPGFVLANYQGLKTKDFEDLRAKLAGKQQGSCKVVKNTLLKKALEKANVSGLEAFLEGPTAVIFQQGDVAAASKLVVEFTKDHEWLKIKAGCMDGRVLAAKEVIEISRLPSRLVLIAQLAGNLNGPIQRFASVLAANLQSLAFALQAVKAKKEAAPGATPG